MHEDIAQRIEACSGFRRVTWNHVRAKGAQAGLQSPDGPSLFGNSGWYYATVARSNLVFLEGRDMVLPVARGWAAFPSSASLRGKPVVLRPLFSRFESFADALQRLSNSVQDAIVVKHVIADGREGAGGLTRYPDRITWSAEAKLDDQTFPEVVVDCRATAKQGRHAAARDIEMELVDQPFAASGALQADIVEFVREWTREFSERRIPHQDRAEFVAWHERGLRNLADDPDQWIWIVRDRDSGDMLGVLGSWFSTATQMDLGLVALSRKIPRSRVVYLRLIERLAQMGVAWLNLGGSEQASLYEFKRSLGPHRLITATHLLALPRKGMDQVRLKAQDFTKFV